MFLHLLIVILLVIGCSNPSATASPDAHDAATGTDAAPSSAFAPLSPPANGVQIHIGPDDLTDPDAAAAWLIAPGDEWLHCVDPGTAHGALNVTAYEIQERPGIHHLTFMVGKAGDAPPIPTTCTPFAGSQLFVAQRAHDHTDLSGGAPEYQGAALQVPAGTWLAEIHALNTSNTPLPLEFWINLETTETPRVPLQWLSLSGGHTMAVPPHTQQTVTASATTTYYPQTIIQLVGHTHSHTTEERATFGGETIYSDTNWAEPTPVWFTSLTHPLTVPKGGSLEWACDINNDSDATLRFGNQAYKMEMCNLIGFIAPTAGVVKPWAAGSF
jgi:hypothetical protein